MDHINKKLRELKTLEGPFHSLCMDSLSKNPYELFLKWFEFAVEADVREPSFYEAFSGGRKRLSR